VLHPNRYWNVKLVRSPKELANKLNEEKSWTLCTAFRLGNLYFFNDAISENGAMEFGVCLPKDGHFIQIESITFGWINESKSLAYIGDLISAVQDGEYDVYSVLSPTFTEDEDHVCCYCR